MGARNFVTLLMIVFINLLAMIFFVFNIKKNFMFEIQNCAMIREVHIYGQAVGIGQKQKGKAQHLGLGTKLIILAEDLAKRMGYAGIAVISAIGTRKYYRKRGFKASGMYLLKNL